MNEMNIQLQTEGSLCLYEQIYEHIKREIREGKLPAGEKLPSTRFLAEYLQVARSTVDYAYAQLLSEGYVESRPCRGYFVCPVEGLFQLEEGTAPGEAERAPGMARTERARCIVDFSPFDIDMSGFPFLIWKRITKNILSYANSDLFAKGEAQGDYGLRVTIARYLHSSRGVNCRPEQIIVGAGNDYLLMLLEKILACPVRIGMENPTYIRSYHIFSSFHYDIVPVEMDEGGMKADMLEQEKVSMVYVMPSHQFPMGTVMPIGRRMELLKWADRKQGRYLIEDDYDSEFRYKGKPIPSLQASDRDGRVIYMGTFSKSIAPAIRVGFMVLPLDLLKIYKENCGFYASTVSRIDQRILNEFIKDGYFERYLNKMRKVYRERHDFLLSKLTFFEKEFMISGENAGLHILLSSKSCIPERELLEAALKHGIKVYGISDACMGREGNTNTLFKSTVLLGYGALDKQELETGIELLKKAWSLYL